jgi:hypothetical protein
MNRKKKGMNRKKGKVKFWTGGRLSGWDLESFGKLPVGVLNEKAAWDHSVMCPAQFRTHCVPNLKCVVKDFA